MPFSTDCSIGDSCSFSYDTKESGNSGEGQRRRGRSSSLAPHSKAKTVGEEGDRDECSDKRENSVFEGKILGGVKRIEDS